MGGFEPTVIATALGAKLGIIDKYSLWIDVHDTMLCLIQITGAAPNEASFLIRGGERIALTLVDWAHVLRLQAAQRRRSNEQQRPFYQREP
jgi:hypothetical protein